MSAIKMECNCLPDKQMIITLLMEHWDEFLSILNGTYHEKDTDLFPPFFYEFAHLLSCALKKAAHINTPHCDQQDTAYPFLIDQESFGDISLENMGLLQRASHLHEKIVPDDKLCNTIINDNGIFIIQREHTYTAPDETFQSLVDSVLL